MNKQLLHRKYPPSWEIRPLSSFAAEGATSIVDGPFGSDLKVSDYTETGVRVLQLQNLGDGYFIDGNRIFVSRDKATQLARCIARPGDLIIAKMADPLARAAILPDLETEYVIVADLIKLRPSEDVDPYYLAAFINFPDFRREADRLSTGTTRTRISLSTLKRIDLLCPPRSTQKRISAVIRAIDDAINNTEVLIAKYQQIKAGLMHDLFTRGVTADGKLRPPREQAPELYQETPIGWIPKEWTVSKLTRCTQTEITYGIVQAGPHIDGGIPYIRTGDMAGDRLERNDLLCTSPAVAEAFKRSEVRAGEIVCAIRATVGKVLDVPEELDGANLTQGTARISPSPDVDRRYLLWVMRSDAVQNGIAQRIKGTTFSEITLGELRSILVPRPTRIDEQQAVAERLDRVVDLINDETSLLEKLTFQKAGLMHDLLTGKVRIPLDIPAPEPAHV